MMFLLLLLVAALAAVAQGQINGSCVDKYYIVNTYQTRDSFSVSCFGVNLYCNVFYSPPGTGCDDPSIEFISTVPQNRTQILTYDFLLGGGICSDNQIAVYEKDYNDTVVAQLPRATEAGTNFFVVLHNSTQIASYQCMFSALSFAANVTVVNGGKEQLYSVDPFKSIQFKVAVFATSRNELKLMSDNSIIVSCVGDGFPHRMLNLQPISSKPLIAAPYEDSTLSVVISNCSTNKLISNFSQVNITYSDETGQACATSPWSGSPDIQTFNVTQRCYFLIKPLHNVCVSVGIQSDYLYLTDMGVPESKLSRRFVQFPVRRSRLLSFSETKCKGFSNKSLFPIYKFHLTRLGGNQTNELSVADLVRVHSETDRLECDDPVLMVRLEPIDTFYFLSGYQPNELWPQFGFACEDPYTMTAANTSEPVEQ